MKAFSFLIFSVLPLLIATKALAEAVANYDPFSDETKVKLRMPSSGKFHTLGASAEFPGKKPSPKTIIFLGFYNSGYKYCPRPGFIADGIRVGAKPEPTSLAQRMLGMTTTYGGPVYNFNFFTLEEVRAIANSRTTQYKLCDSVFVLTQDEKNKLKAFVRLFQ
ncbi:MAG: hypothetical protein MH252_19615 [Thermosynechococcaceae cyanobacterium MS004]|nr:hypothetical protein [Thermosynechococcaceae cyanobacterium MS004]